MEYFWVCMALGGICAWLAARKRRSVFGWFILGFLFSFFALIIIIFLDELPDPAQLNAPAMKKCPFCAEDIRLEAKKCRYCGEMLSQLSESEEFFETLDQKPLAKDWEKRALNKGQRV